MLHDLLVLGYWWWQPREAGAQLVRIILQVFGGTIFRTHFGNWLIAVHHGVAVQSLALFHQSLKDRDRVPPCGSSAELRRSARRGACIRHASSTRGKRHSCPRGAQEAGDPRSSPWRFSNMPPSARISRRQKLASPVLSGRLRNLPELQE